MQEGEEEQQRHAAEGHGDPRRQRVGSFPLTRDCTGSVQPESLPALRLQFSISGAGGSAGQRAELEIMPRVPGAFSPNWPEEEHRAGAGEGVLSMTWVRYQGQSMEQELGELTVWVNGRQRKRGTPREVSRGVSLGQEKVLGRQRHGVKDRTTR